jgi:hypothetical protein
VAGLAGFVADAGALAVLLRHRLLVQLFRRFRAGQDLDQANGAHRAEGTLLRRGGHGGFGFEQ